MVPPVTKLYATALLLLNLAACASKPASTHSEMDMPGMHHMMMSERASAFAQTMRRLWAEDIVLTRLYVMSVTGGSGDTKQIVARLLQKQEEIGDALAPYYGAAASQQLTDLLKQRAVMTTADQRSRDNAAAIAALLEQPSLAGMLNELQSVDKKNLEASFDQAMIVADALAHGIIMQFPDRF